MILRLVTPRPPIERAFGHNAAQRSLVVQSRLGLSKVGVESDPVFGWRVRMTIREPDFVELATPSGPMRTHVFRPTGENRYPGLLLFSEIFQATAPIRRTAAFLAGHGFIVAVPEIYHEFEPAGTILPYDQTGADRGNALKTTKELAHYDADARAVLDYLQTHGLGTGQVGTLGICIGGHLAFRAAMNPGVNAAVCFYATDIHKRSLGKGMNDNSLDRIGEIKGELLMIWGRQDPHVPAEGRAKVYQALTAAGANFTWHEFNGAHAFLRDEGHRYDPELAHQTMAMAVSLFRRTLGNGNTVATTQSSVRPKPNTSAISAG